MLGSMRLLLGGERLVREGVKEWNGRLAVAHTNSSAAWLRQLWQECLLGRAWRFILAVTPLASHGGHPAGPFPGVVLFPIAAGRRLRCVRHRRLQNIESTGESEGVELLVEERILGFFPLQEILGRALLYSHENCPRENGAPQAACQDGLGTQQGSPDKHHQRHVCLHGDGEGELHGEVRQKIEQVAHFPVLSWRVEWRSESLQHHSLIVVIAVLQVLVPFYGPQAEQLSHRHCLHEAERSL
mmetsp:Transcript_23444/g.65038  ORF Transcript_23444/g.65038 Transcript_23444/m.65038 type:complete len:242 (-) Transcript_23444:1368-2093(-)